MAVAPPLQKIKVSTLLFGDGTPRKALLTALIVGTALTFINHGDTLLAGQFPPVVKVILTYCVPYCVTTWGAATGKLAQSKRQQTPLADLPAKKEHPL